jgi:hypothetical protein
MADDININIGANPAGVEQGSRRAKAALKGVTDGGKDLDAALRRLRQSIDPTFEAMEKFNKTKADNLALLRAGLVTRKEYNAAMKVAKQTLESETEAIQRNSAAGKAAAAEALRLKREQAAEAKRVAAEERQAAREAAQAKRQAEREAAAEARRAAAEEKAAAREAAAIAKQQAREAAAVEREMKRQLAQEARETAQIAKAAAREKAAEEKRQAREAAEAEKEAKRQAREAAREAAAAAKAAAREKAAAEREAARVAREAAEAAREMARQERAASNAAQELRASIDPAYAAQMRYNETMRRATQLLMQNKLQQGEWNAIQTQARAQMDLNVRSLGRQNAMYVQLGYQAQDVTASLASGINPLVILAQQGGQTAAALSTMGGTAGRVAAFFAGPWGAAIIGATLLLGYLWESLSDGEEATKDLMNAEDRRAMSVKELTSAIREYTNAQRDANETTMQGAIHEANQLMRTQAEVMGRLKDAQDSLTSAQEIYNATRRTGNAIQIGVAYARLKYAESQVRQLQKAHEDASEAAGEARAAYAQTYAEMSELERREQNELTAALGRFRREWQAAGTDAAAQARATTNYQTELAKIQTRYNELKEEERELRRANERAAKDEGKAIFASREAAIQQAGNELLKGGYAVGENFGIGDGKVGKHPGMGRTAHGKYAIDINVPGIGNEAADTAAKARMDKMVAAYQARGFRILWNGKVYNPHGGGPSYDIPANQGQHRDHAHMEAPASIVGKPAGGKLGQQLAQEEARALQELERAREEALRDHVARIDFEQELNREDLQIVLALQDQKIAAIKDFYGETSREATNASRERIRIERSMERELLDLQKSAIDQRYEMMSAAAAAEEQVRQIRSGMDGASVDAGLSGGILNASQALAQKAAILDREYQQQQAHETRMFRLTADAIRARLELENLPAKQKRELHEQLERLEADHLNRMTVMNAEYARDVQGIAIEAANQTNARWKDVSSTMTSSLRSGFQGIWTHSQTLQESFIDAADQMVYKFVDMGAQMFEDWIMRQVGMTAVQQTQEAARTASTVGAQAAQSSAVAAGAATQTGAKAAAAGTEQTIIAATTGAKIASEAIKTSAATTGAAAQTGVAASAGMSEVTTNAAVAASGAYKSTVVIPFIGPVAAPAAAALALAAVMGFGALISARGGQGEVPFDGQLSMLHKKEMVLPEQFAVPLRNMLVSPRSSAALMGATAAMGTSAREAGQATQNAANFYYQPRHTNMGAGFDELLRQDGRSLRKWIRNEVRNGGLKF